MVYCFGEMGDEATLLRALPYHLVKKGGRNDWEQMQAN
jgi:hypothetical protein